MSPPSSKEPEPKVPDLKVENATVNAVGEPKGDPAQVNGIDNPINPVVSGPTVSQIQTKDDSHNGLSTSEGLAIGAGVIALITLIFKLMKR